MLPELQKISLTDFRNHASMAVRWVEESGGHLWITRHGKVKSVLIPRYEADMLDRVLMWHEGDHIAELEREYTRWKAAKAIQAHEHARRLKAGWANKWQKTLNDR